MTPQLWWRRRPAGGFFYAYETAKPAGGTPALPGIELFGFGCDSDRYGNTIGVTVGTQAQDL